MLLDISRDQFHQLVKEALDSMTDREYVAFAKKVADEATLRGLTLVFETHITKRVVRTRKEKHGG